MGVGLGRGNWAARGDSARGRKKKKKERLGRFGLWGKEEKEREIGLGWKERGRKVFHFPLKKLDSNKFKLNLNSRIQTQSEQQTNKKCKTALMLTTYFSYIYFKAK